MRPASAILFATGILWAGWASAQTGLPPGVTLEDAGLAAGFGQFLCGIPGSQIDAFRQKVDSLASGGTLSANFHSGEARARKMIDQVRQNGADYGDTRELRDSSCDEVNTTIAKTLAVP